MTTFARKCTEFIVISCPFRPPRSPSSADDKAVELMLESDNAVEDAGKTVCVIEGSVRRYGRCCAK
jgi:hypothetical protein